MNEVPNIVQETAGYRPSLAAVYRWRQRGINGVRLRTRTCGSHRRTCQQWIEDFFDELTRLDGGEHPGDPASEQRPRESNASQSTAERELADAGI